MYSEKVLDHFRNPRNSGEMENPDGEARKGNPACGDVMQIQIRVRNGVLSDIKFKTFGCAAAIATASMVTELAKGKTVEDAKKITFDDILKELGGLPPVKTHCSLLAIEALRASIADYEKREKPKKGKKLKKRAQGVFSALAFFSAFYFFILLYAK